MTCSANRVGAGHFAALPPSSFSEMSPVCFCPAFDGIGAVWFTPNEVERRSERDGGGTGGFFGTSSTFLTQGKNLNAAEWQPSFLLGWSYITAIFGKKNYGKENQF
jgi:hypothetical protein